MIEIRYNQDISPQWANAIRSVASVSELVKLCEDYGVLTLDALEVAKTMTDDNLIEFKEGLLSEARGVYAGDNWANKYIHVFMPDKMVDITCLAGRFNCPEGLIYHRMLEEKLL